MTNERTEQKHPAFGQITAHRWHGGAGTAMYGSDFEHRTGIDITIHRSTLMRDLSRDWHHSGEALITVRLSEAQWATFVSSLNCGSGVPCTLDRVMGEKMPELRLRHEQDVAKKELDERVARVGDLLRDAIADVESNTAGLSKVKQAAVLERLRRVQKDVTDSMPFAAKSFAEHMETVTEKAKVEIEAHMHATIQRAGLKALAGAETPIQIPDAQP